MTEPESTRPNLHLVYGDGTSGTDTPSEHYRLRLYIAGQTSKSLAAVANLKTICAQYLEGRCSIEVVDLMDLPGHDVLVVRQADGFRAMIPFVEAFVPEVDVDGGRVIVTPPYGLLSGEEPENTGETAGA